MTVYQNNVGGNYVSILLNRQIFSIQMGIKSTKLLWQVHISSFSNPKNLLRSALVFLGGRGWPQVATTLQTIYFFGETLFSASCDFSAIFQLLHHLFYFIFLFLCCLSFIIYFFNIKVDIPYSRIWGDIPPFRVIGSPNTHWPL